MNWRELPSSSGVSEKLQEGLLTVDKWHYSKTDKKVKVRTEASVTDQKRGSGQKKKKEFRSK